MAMKTTWLVLGALLVVGCVGADDEPPVEGVGGTQMQTQGTGGSAPTGTGGAAYTTDPAPTCTDAIDQTIGCNVGGSPTTNKYGSYCVYCAPSAAWAPGGCSVRAGTDIAFASHHDILCVYSASECDACKVYWPGT